MPLTVYTHFDTGAPTLSGTTALSKMRDVLKACLVDGYGDKPAAGWTMPHDVSGGFSLSNGDGVVSFTARATDHNSLDVYVMESITDASTKIPSGVNRRSGVWSDLENAGTSVRHYLVFNPSSSQAGFNYSLHGNKWTVVADEKTCIAYLYGLNSSGQVQEFVNSSSTSTCIYIGKYWPYSGALVGPETFIAIAGNRGTNQPGGGFDYTNATPSNTAQLNTSLLRNPFTGTQTLGSSLILGATATKGEPSAGQEPTTPIPDRLCFSRLRLRGVGSNLNGATISTQTSGLGTLRGVVAENDLSYATPQSWLGSLSGKPTAAIPEVFAGIDLPGGVKVVPLFSGIYNPARFVLADPAFW